MGQKVLLRWSLTYQQGINREMAIAAINPNLSSKYLLAGSHISAPGGFVTKQAFKAGSHFSNYLAKSREIGYTCQTLKIPGNSYTQLNWQKEKKIAERNSFCCVHLISPQMNHLISPQMNPSPQKAGLLYFFDSGLLRLLVSMMSEFHLAIMWPIVLMTTGRIPMVPYLSALDSM